MAGGASHALCVEPAVGTEGQCADMAGTSTLLPDSSHADGGAELTGVQGAWRCRGKLL